MSTITNLERDDWELSSIVMVKVALAWVTNSELDCQELSAQGILMFAKYCAIVSLAGTEDIGRQSRGVPGEVFAIEIE